MYAFKLQILHQPRPNHVQPQSRQRSRCFGNHRQSLPSFREQVGNFGKAQKPVLKEAYLKASFHRSCFWQEVLEVYSYRYDHDDVQSIIGRKCFYDVFSKDNDGFEFRGHGPVQDGHR